ncbi:MAG: T9SS type A sorting domain-containing protein [Bacteroidota bacterium]
MKKLLLSATLLLSSAAIFAQTGVQAPVANLKAGVAPKANMPEFNNDNSNTIRKTLAKKAVVEGWYQPLEWLKETAVGAGLKRSAVFISADSNFKVIYNSGEVGDPNFQSFGQVFDPKDELMNLSDAHAGLLLDQWSDYTIDSVGFLYSYLRNTDSTDNNMDGVKEEVIDTVFVAYYANANVEKNSFVQSKDKIGLIKWDNAKRFPASYLRVDTFLLGNDRSNSPIDTTRLEGTSVFSKFSSFAPKAPISVTKNNLVGFTVTFKSGVPAVLGNDTLGYDTAVAVDLRDGSPTTARRANIFGTVYSFNESTSGNEYTNLDAYNTPQFMPQWSAYGQNANWAGRYVPGFGAFVNDLFTETAFYSKSLNASVKENDLVDISSIFPNPASSAATVNFNLKKSGIVKISMLNVIGQEVSSINAGNLVAGNNSVSLDVNTLSAGVYFVNITVDGVSTTKKLTVGQ